MAQSVPKRMAIISAGVIMNVIFAFIMATVAYALGVKQTPCIVRGVVPGGAAWHANLQPGDVITQIGKIENPRFRDLQTGVTLGDLSRGVQFVIHRPGQEQPIELTLHPDTSLGVPMIGIVGPWQNVLNDKDPTLDHSPAGMARPKFEPGDTIVKVGDVATPTQIEIEHQLALHVDDRLPITADRTSASPRIAKNEHPGEQESEVRPATIEVDPTPLRDFGLIMTAGPIVAVQDESPAAKAGIKSGDRLESIDGKPAGNPLTLPERMRRAAVAGKSVKVEIQRDADDKTEKLALEVTPRIPQFAEVLLPVNPMSTPALGIAYKVWTKVAAVEPGSPAAEADIQPGDEITAVKLIPPDKQEADAGEEDRNASDAAKLEFDEKDPAWPYFIFEALPFADPNVTVRFWVKRGDETRQVDLKPTELKDDTGKTLHTPARGLIFQPLYTLRSAHSVGEAIRLGGHETVDSLLLVYRFLQKISENQISVKLLGGPVEIARQAGMSAQQGMSSFLLFLTMLSANLAVINFLPIPVLDGGHMVFLLYEGIRGKPASERVVIGFTYAGLVFILSLMVFVLSLDLGLISRR